MHKVPSVENKNEANGTTTGIQKSTKPTNDNQAEIAEASASNSSRLRENFSPQVIGFAVASKKRNRPFHQLFRSVPEDDYLIEDFACTLQREILFHGRMYISEGHVCFYSNIFSWINTVVLAFDEIVSVKKTSTSIIFNGLEITTLHAKHVFASLPSGPNIYELMVGVWKLNHPRIHVSSSEAILNSAVCTDRMSATSNSDSDKSCHDDSGEVHEEDSGSEAFPHRNSLDPPGPVATSMFA